MIEVKNLNKIYNENTSQAFSALKEINLTIKKGEFVVLKGVSGSGKSTLMSILATLIKPTSGSVEIDNENVVKLPDEHSSHFRLNHLGFVFQSFNLFENLNVFENVSIPLVPLGIKMDEIEQKVQKALNLANIEHKKDQEVNSLSGGEKQRCAIARALVNDPNLILCDEPTANLDKENSQIFLEIVKKLNSMGKTIIIATHDPLFDSLDFDSRIIHMEDGKIIE